jgi:hypothetical protein
MNFDTPASHPPVGAPRATPLRLGWKATGPMLVVSDLKATTVPASEPDLSDRCSHGLIYRQKSLNRSGDSYLETVLR